MAKKASRAREGQTMTTDTAQRRLLEAIAAVQRAPDLDHGASPDPLAALIYAVRVSVGFVQQYGQPEVARVYEALGELVAAVRDDKKEPTR